MPRYSSLAALRSALTTEDADDRGQAYGAILNAPGNVQPSDVLSNDPDEDVLEPLQDDDVLPESASANRRSNAEHREEQTELLREIRDLLADDVTVQDGDSP